MPITLPLDSMTIEEKIQTMETLWEDLARNADALEPPPWHGVVLASLEVAIEQGDVSFSDWDTAKKRIRDRLA